MTIAEFQAWLEGFGEAIGDAPTPEQWAKIKEKVSELKAVDTRSLRDFLPTPVWPEPRRIGEPMWTGPSDIIAYTKPYTTTCAN